MEYIDIYTGEGKFTGIKRPKHDQKNQENIINMLLL